MTGRFRKLGAIGLIVAAVAGASVATATPALARSSGSSYIQPGGGCNTGTYYYRSSQSGSRAEAFTSFDGYCWGSKTPGARAIAGSSVGAWAYYPGTSVSTSIANSSGATPYGNHSINNGYPRNT
jgi:hypothetical protein